MSLDPTDMDLLAKQTDEIMMALATRLEAEELPANLRTFILAHGHHAEDHLKAARDDLDRIAELLEGK